MTFWDECLFKHYRESPSSVSVIQGKWKTGKTDFALFLCVDELRDRLGVIKEVATNIKTNGETVYINNFDDLEVWLFKNKDRKAFIFDEAIKSSPSRAAMSKINVRWLQYIPELSKARCHMFVITQEAQFTEKLFLHPTFVRAHWIKRDLKTVDLISPFYKHICRFNELPKTKVEFDPYSIAVWQLEAADQAVVDNDIKIALEYARGERSHNIMRKYGLRYRSDLMIAIRRAIEKMYSVYERRARLEASDLTTENKELQIPTST
ncbi:MAG: hypothetical protein QXQ64_02395 [Candidatus Bathyarchaeia archaeon]